MRLLLLPFAILAAILIAFLAERPPALRQDGSATAAMRDVGVIAREPHVAGSAANHRVRQYLLSEFGRIGVRAEIQRSFAARQWPKLGGLVTASPVENVVAIIPGRSRSAPAVAVMAHYDSVPFSPGAGDDAAGVAAVLRTARTLAQGPRPFRDVVIIMTDGEEVGLLGAEAFFKHHRLAPRIEIVVNAEARGSSGRASLFQSSPGDAGMISLWAREVARPTGNSLTGSIYRQLPNDTDLSVALETGKKGMNFAFVGGQVDYHSPTDTREKLSGRSVQHLGDAVTAVTRSLAMAERLPTHSVDATFFDVFGLAVVRYGAWLGWVLLAAATAGTLVTISQTRKLGARPRDVLLSALCILVAAVALGAVLQLFTTFAYGDDPAGQSRLLGDLPIAIWFYSALVAGAVLLFRPGIATWLACLAIALLSSLTLQFLLPAGAFLTVLPLLIALALGSIAIKAGVEARSCLWTTALAGTLTCAWCFQLLHQAFVGVGAIAPAIVVLGGFFVILLLYPLTAPWRRHRTAVRAGGTFFLLAGVLGLGWIALQGDEAPGDGGREVFHATDPATGQSFWATTTSNASDLPKGPRLQRSFAPHLSQAWWATPAPALARISPRVETRLHSDGAQRWVGVTTSVPARALRVAFRPRVPLQSARLNGWPVSLPVSKWTVVRFGAHALADLRLSFKSTDQGSVEISYLIAAEEPSIPAPSPSASTLFSGARVTTGATIVCWPGANKGSESGDNGPPPAC